MSFTCTPKKKKKLGTKPQTRNLTSQGFLNQSNRIGIWDPLRFCVFPIFWIRQIKEAFESRTNITADRGARGTATKRSITGRQQTRDEPKATCKKSQVSADSRCINTCLGSLISPLAPPRSSLTNGRKKRSMDYYWLRNSPIVFLTK